MMAGDHLSARQRSTTWWAQHPLNNTTGLHPDTTGPSTGTSRISLPRYGTAGMPLVDRRARLYTYNGVPGGTHGLTLECVYVTTTTAFNFFGGPWYRRVVAIYGNYGYVVGIELAPLNDAAGDTQGRANILVRDIGQVWPNTLTYDSRKPINDGRPHHLAIVWSHGDYTASLYVDGVLAQQRTYEGFILSFLDNDVHVSADQYFTHADGDVSHVAAGAAVSAAEVRARANLTPNGPLPLPNTGQHLGWDSAGNGWRPVKAWDGSNWKVMA